MNDSRGPAHAYMKSIAEWQTGQTSHSAEEKRIRGFKEKFHPAEIPQRKRAPESGLTDFQRKQRGTITGVVTSGPDGELFIQARGLPEILLRGSDYAFKAGDRVDIAVIRQTGTFSKYMILGRRTAEREATTDGFLPTIPTEAS